MGLYQGSTPLTNSGATLLYTEQNLAESQKIQARKNIGALGENEVAQGDWSQNDPNAASYIQNKTHWSETNTIILLPKTTITLNEDFNNSDYGKAVYHISDMDIINSIEQLTCKIIWDEVEFESGYIDDGSYIYLTPGEEYKTDFVAYLDIDTWDIVFIQKDAKDTNHTFSLINTEEIVHQLDKKFIPSEVGAQSDWAQNDDTKSDYIKNRTHYDIYEFKPHISIYYEGPILDYPLTLNDGVGSFGLGYGGFSGNGDFSDTLYKIIIDGEEHIVKPYEDHWRFVFVFEHQDYIVQIEENEFCMGGYYDFTFTRKDGLEIVGESHHTISMYAQESVAVPLDKKYLPKEAIKEISLEKSKENQSLRYVDEYYTIPTYGHSIVCDNSDYDDEYYVIAGRDGLYRSYDGVHWDTCYWEEDYEGLSDIEWTHLAIMPDDSQWVAASSKYFAYSYYGYWWSLIQSPFEDETDIASLIYGKDKFIAINDNYQLSISENGYEWSTPITVDFKAIGYGNDKYIGLSYRQCYVSSDGLNWELSNNRTPIYSNWYDWQIDYVKDKFIASSSIGSMYSYDAINWIEINVEEQLNKVIYTNNKFISYSIYPLTITYSDDGITWIFDEKLTSNEIQCVDSFTYGKNSNSLIFIGEFNDYDYELQEHVCYYYSAKFDLNTNKWTAKRKELAYYTDTDVTEKIKNLLLNDEIDSIKSYVDETVINSQIQSDWNQNDETAPDYVKNRFGGYITEVKNVAEVYYGLGFEGSGSPDILLENLEAEMNNDLGYSRACVFELSDYPDWTENVFDVNSKYIITLNGVEYQAEVYSDDHNKLIVRMDGYNLVFHYGTNSAWSYFEVYAVNESYATIMIDDLGTYEFTIYRLKETPVPLDAKFLPNSVATKADIEAAIGLAIGGSY